MIKKYRLDEVMLGMHETTVNDETHGQTLTMCYFSFDPYII
jgi:hypothetical protein